MRPAQRVLFIGNSRTHFNNLPSLLQNMASAELPFRYEVMMHAPGGHTFEDHATNSAVRSLLDAQWDYVVLQGGSPENTNPDSRQAFIEYGQKLATLARQGNSLPTLMVAWVYDENTYDAENEQYLKPYYLEYAASYQAHLDTYGKPPQGRPAPESFFPLNIATHFDFIQKDHRQLAMQTGALLVNVGQAFQALQTSSPGTYKLTSDGNHPSLQGSYLAAAMLHACFSKMPAQSIRYVPSGLSEQDALGIRVFIDTHYPDGTCTPTSAETQ